jgi:hypothetical protein
VDTKKSRALARKSAQESLVLLSTNGDLPWNPTHIGKLAILGPNSNSTGVLLSNYNAPCGKASKYVNVGLPGRPCHLVSVLAGAGAALPNADIVYEKGCDLNSTDASGIAGAVAAAQTADAAILVVGLVSAGSTEPVLENEAHDRVKLTLPGLQLDLIRAVLAVQPRTIVVIMSGSAVSIPELMDPHPRSSASPGKNVPAAVIQQFYPGEEGGNALLDAVLGTTDFSGKLPVTIVESVAELPPYLDQNMSMGPGRTYRYYKGEPLYSFGYGASAHQFTYTDLEVSPHGNGTSLKRRGGSAHPTATPTALQVSFRLAVKPPGAVAPRNVVPPIAAEVVQVYVSFAPGDAQSGGPVPFDGGSAVPRWDLKYFDRVEVSGTEKQLVVTTIPLKSLALASEDGTLKILPGRYTFTVGGTSPGTPTRLLRPAAPWGPQKPITASFVLSDSGAILLD